MIYEQDFSKTIYLVERATRLEQSIASEEKCFEAQIADALQSLKRHIA